MASGAVLLKTPDLLAWKIEIEWADVEDFKDYDQNLLVSFVDRFPDDSLAKVLIGFMQSEISPFENLTFVKSTQKESEKGKTNVINSKKQSRSESAQQELQVESMDTSDSNLETDPSEIEDSIEGEVLEEIEGNGRLSPALVLEYMTDGYSSDPTSLLACRILGAYYIRLREYETASDIGIKSLDLVKNLKKSYGLSCPNSLNHLQSILGMAYVFYQAPKNFDLALQLFGQILSVKPGYTAAKIGKGLIFREQSKYSKAQEFLKSALDEQPDNAIVLFEYSWCQILLRKYEAGRSGLFKAMEGIAGNDSLSHDYRAQIWWRIGQSYWLEHESEEEYDQQTVSALFGAFTSSLKENPNYAPTFTSLGKLYSTVLNDVVRATKCFYKAFEIDGGEIEAAEHLATEFADTMQWDLVDVVATRVIESERVRLSSGKEPSWPYRALGISSLNSRDYQKAVKCFQSAIRLSPEDVNSWVGLGEAYTNSGRYVAAAKTFTRAQLLDPENWIATYHLGIVQRLTYGFHEAIRTFQKVSSLRPNENGVKFALIETMLMAGKHELKKEVFGQAAILASDCIKTASEAIKAGLELTQDLWKVLSECCEIYLIVQSKLPAFPMDLLIEVVKENAFILSENEDMLLLSKRDEVTVLSLEESSISETAENREDSESSEDDLGTELTPIYKLQTLYILLLKISFIYARKDKNTRATAWYNLGLGKLRVYLMANRRESKILYTSVDCFKRVIRLQNNNPDVWNAYGVACLYLNGAVAQHCFIRSLSLDSKHPAAWNNLAVFYTQLHDIELSEAAFGRSLIIDPDFAPAWIGKGIVAHVLGDSQEAHKCFEHSFKISNGMNKVSKLYYALSVFEQLKNKTNEVMLAEKLENAVICLQKYLILSPESTLALNLQGLIMERISNYEYAIEHATKLCEIYESDYESYETQDFLIKFVKAKAHLARVSLGARQYEAAIEHGEFASDVSNDVVEPGDELSNELKKSRLSAFLTCGLGYYFLNEYGNSIECFKSALVESDEDQDVIVLLAQVLWAQGGADEKEVALEQLFGSIEKSGASCKLALTLGAIGIVHDNELIEAAEDELKSFSETTLATEDESNQVPQMLAAINHTKGKDIKEPWYKAAFYMPWSYDVWRHIEPQTALELAKTGENVSSSDLSTAYINASNGVESSQRAVFYAPWTGNAWLALSEAV